MQSILSNSTYIGRHPLGVTSAAIIDESVFNTAQVFRKSNKQLHPPRKDPWPLQGRLKCSNCGSTLQCEYSGGHRYYRCPGRSTRSKYYLETGKKCTLGGMRADDVEEQLLSATCDAMLNPDSFAKALERTIHELQGKIVDLEREAEPLERALADAEKELQRIERAWIRGRLSEEELHRMEREVEARRDRIQTQLDARDFGDLEELSGTRRLITAAQQTLEMARTVDGGWWSHPEAPPTWFTDVLVPPGWSSGERVHEDTLEEEVYDTFPPIDPDHIGRTLNEALNRLQAQVWASPGVLELRGIIDVTVPPQNGVRIPGVLTKRGNDDGPQPSGTPSTGSPRTGRGAHHERRIGSAPMGDWTAASRLRYHAASFTMRLHPGIELSTNGKPTWRRQPRLSPRFRGAGDPCNGLSRVPILVIGRTVRFRPWDITSLTFLWITRSL